MAYQFVHLGTFSRKGNADNRSVYDICGEAARLDGHAPHVERPGVPVVLYGISPADIPAEIDRLASDARKALRGRGRGASIRQDTHVLEASVWSHPAFCRETPGQASLSDPVVAAEYERWRIETVAWAIADAERRGRRVLSVIEHLDEMHPHLHLLAVAENSRLDAKQGHPGHAAKTAALAEGKSLVEANRAYREAMTAWLDQYWREIGMRHGLARIGPARRRLTRGEWKAEEAERKRVAEALRAAESAEEITQELQAASAAIEVERAAMALLKDGALAAQRTAEAYKVGVDAWSDGHIVGAVLEAGQKRFTLSPTLTEPQQRELVKAVTPAWEMVWDFIAAMAVKLEARLKNAFKSRIAALEGHLRAEEQRALSISRGLDALGDRAAATEAQIIVDATRRRSPILGR